MTMTLNALAQRHAVELPEHLEQQADIPVNTGLQRQGDLMFIPQMKGKAIGTPVGNDGQVLVRGENGGNTHLLVADGDVTWRDLSDGSQDIGVFDVAKGATAYVLHPEHGGQGFAPGSYIVRRQREQADQIRLVAD